MRIILKTVQSLKFRFASFIVVRFSRSSTNPGVWFRTVSAKNSQATLNVSVRCIFVSQRKRSKL